MASAISNLLLIFISLSLLALLIYALTVNCSNVTDIKEGWVDYEQLPFGNVQSGAGNIGVRPISFYQNIIYRKPLNWPVCNLVDYPVPHCRSNSLH
jgi:hypothetical protein